MVYNLFAWGRDHKVEIRASSYCVNGNLALSLFEIGEGPYEKLTVNLTDERLPMNQAYVDTNNCAWAETFIYKNKLGVHTGKFKVSGFYAYPLYEFDLEKIGGVA